MYHAGILYSERRKAHKQFVNDKVSVIIATVAFGMGIDKPDIRRVVHYGGECTADSGYSITSNSVGYRTTVISQTVSLKNKIKLLRFLAVVNHYNWILLVTLIISLVRIQ